MSLIANIVPKLKVLLFMAVLLGLTSCSEGRQRNRDSYIKTVQSGLKVLPWPKQMEELYGQGDHSIIHYHGSDGSKPWQSIVFLHGRYRLTMEVTVGIDYKKDEIKASGHPKFYLVEVKSVRSNGSGVGTTFQDQWTLDEEEWKKLVASGGDWSQFGVMIKTNDPVPGFDAFAKGSRAPITVPR